MMSYRVPTKGGGSVSRVRGCVLRHVDNFITNLVSVDRGEGDNSITDLGNIHGNEIGLATSKLVLNI